MNAETLTEIKKQIEIVEQSGFGEVTIKVQNGFVWRIIISCDKLIAKEVRSLEPSVNKLVPSSPLDNDESLCNTKAAGVEGAVYLK